MALPFLCLLLHGLQHSLAPLVVKVLGDEKKKPLKVVHFVNMFLSLLNVDLSHVVKDEVQRGNAVSQMCESGMEVQICGMQYILLFSQPL